MRFEFRIVVALDPALQRIVEAVLFNQEALMATIADMRAKIAELVTEVQAQTTVVQSVEDLLGKLHEMLTAAVSDGDLAAVQDALDLVKTNGAALADAVAANTVADPEPIPTA